METLRQNIEKEVIINKVLRTYIEEYDTTTLIIEEIKDLSTMEIDHLINSLTSHEKRVFKREKIVVSNTYEQAFSIKENEG